MASVTKQYIEQYAEYAIEQQRKYGIPASVILAQGILESANGKSQLSRECNNHFGVKASASWIANGGEFGVYTDDKPNEKFCKYSSVADSYEHHSQFLKDNKRYSECFTHGATDYKAWCHSLQKAGYASSNQYAESMISVIDKMGLAKYDQIAEERGAIKTADTKVDYSFPVKRNEFLLVTSTFGMRNDPLKPTEKQNHKGIDIGCRNDAVLATENNGKVVATINNTETAGGKCVMVEYGRDDGTKYLTSYYHLSEISVKVGDIVNAADKIGVSGNTGWRTTGEHLHFGVKHISADGVTRDIDPVAYLAEIAEKGNLGIKVLNNGNNLLAKYATPISEQEPDINNEITEKEDITPDDWMKKLLSSEDSGTKIPMNDPVVEMAVTMFSSLLALAVQIDNKNREEAMEMASEVAVNEQLNISSLTPNLRACYICLNKETNPTLAISTDNLYFVHTLSNAEVSRLSAALNNNTLSNEERQQRISSLINNIVVKEQMSISYNRNVSEENNQGLQMR